MHAQEAKQSMRGGSMMGWLVGPACLGVVEQIDQRLPGHNARLHRLGQLAVHSLAVSLAIHTEFLRKGLGSHAREPRRAPRRACCRSHRDAGRIALHRDQCECVEHLGAGIGRIRAPAVGQVLEGAKRTHGSFFLYEKSFAQCEKERGTDVSE